MDLYEKLLRESPVPIDDAADLPENLKGLYIETTSARAILLNKRMSTSAEKATVLAEEIGHYYTSSGDIVDQDSLTNRKQERSARAWAYRRLVPLRAFVEAHKASVRNRHELAEYLQVTEEFLTAAIEWYKEKYGLSVAVDGYTVIFEPLGVLTHLE